jgi:hypothetical protein
VTHRRVFDRAVAGEVHAAAPKLRHRRRNVVDREHQAVAVLVVLAFVESEGRAVAEFPFREHRGHDHSRGCADQRRIKRNRAIKIFRVVV